MSNGIMTTTLRSVSTDKKPELQKSLGVNAPLAQNPQDFSVEKLWEKSKVDGPVGE